jgi:hypothetical protein
MENLVVLLKNWKTSIVGFGLILFATWAIKGGVLDPATGAAIIAAGIGLVLAKDGNKTSEDVGLHPPVETLIFDTAKKEEGEDD